MNADEWSEEMSQSPRLVPILSHGVPTYAQLCWAQGFAVQICREDSGVKAGRGKLTR